jgi:hypothetical protein
MKIKTSELTGTALDWAVAKCEGIYFEDLEDFEHSAPDYSNWAQGGPIIEREKISILEAGTFWGARPLQDGATPTRDSYGPTPLIAAMRCYVASKLGDDVDVPEELTK